MLREYHKSFFKYFPSKEKGRFAYANRWFLFKH
jgi:hypothetical protein